MNIFEKFGALFMSLFNKYNVESVTGIKTALSSEMTSSIDLWNSILSGRAKWNAEARPSGIVETTIGQLSNAVSEELDVAAPNNEMLDAVMKKLNENSKEIIQNVLGVGGCIVRPVYANSKLQYEIIKLGNYIPTSYDLDGTLLSCVITKKISEKDKEYLLLENHEFVNNSHKVTTKLYKIAGTSLKEVELTSCNITKDITPVYIWGVDKDGKLVNNGKGIEKPFIVEFRNRAPNKIDGSNVPCALWQNTENLIEDADKQYARINWEQEGGEMVVFADEDLFKKRQQKNKGDYSENRLKASLNKLIVKIQGNGTSEDKIQTHAPALRTAQQVEAFNQILRRCELAWNIGKGTLSDLEMSSQTATQFTGGKKALYSMVDSLESELEEKYKELAYVFAYMISAYKGVKFNDDLSITYNDTARKDPEQLRLAAITEVQNKIISPAEYRMRVFGEDEETANGKVPEQSASALIGGFNLE